MSQYIANLNTIPSAADAAAPQDFASFEDDLALFTNTQFFDFDMNQSVPKLSGDIPFGNDQSRGQQQPQQNENKSMNFVNRKYPTHLSVGPSNCGSNLPLEPDFQFPDFTFAQPQRMPSQSLPPTPPNGLASYQSQQPATLPPHTQTTFAQSPVTGDKRKSVAASISSPVDYDDHSRVAAEEDKRRRNTAASARFRVKKKQREQALEKSAKEMSDKVQFLEARVGQLEMENKWLKGLITEKNLKGADAKAPASSTLPTKDDADRSTDQRKDGVGTNTEAASETTA